MKENPAQTPMWQQASGEMMSESTSEGGSLSMSPPNFSLSAGAPFPGTPPVQMAMSQNAPIQRQETRENFDPEATAEQIYNLLLRVYNREEVQEYALNGLVVNITREQGDELRAAYNRRYNRDLVQDVYRFLNDHPRDFVGGLLAPLTWIMSTGDSDSQDYQGSRARGNGAQDLLPGEDAIWSEGSIYVEGPVGKYAVVGSPVKVCHRDTRQYLTAPGSDFRPPFIERAILNDAMNERRDLRVRNDNGLGYVEFNPDRPGIYQYQVYVRHPDQRIQVLEGSIEAKTTEQIGSEAMETEPARASGETSIEFYRARLELQRQQMQAQGTNTAPLNEYIEQVDAQLENIAEGTEVPFQAVYTQRENGGSQVLSLYAGKEPGNPNRFKILDLTPGVSRREYGGSSFEDALDDFDSANTYPDGTISLRINANDRNIPAINRQIETDGASFLQSLSSGAGWTSLGLSALGVASLFIPGAQVAAPYLFIAAAGAGVASGTASLADRFREAEVSASGVTLDVLGIAGSILGGAAAFRALSQGGRVLTLANGGRFLIYSEIAVEGGSALVLSYEGVQQINQILESDLPRGEKIGQVTRVLSGMALASGLMILSTQDLNATRTNLGRYFGAEAVDALDDQTMMALSLMDDAQLQTLSRVPRGELSEYTELIATDWNKGRQLLSLGQFDNFGAFSRAFNGLDAAGVHRLNQVFDPAYLATLSESMRDRYQRLINDILVGGVSTRNLGERLEGLSEVGTFRNAVREAAENTSRNQARRIAIGQRNIAFSNYELTLPGGGSISGDLAAVSGSGVGPRISTLAESNPGVDAALNGRTMVPEIDDGNRVFRITDAERANDSEAKIMEYIVRQINQQTGLNLQVGNTYSGFSGRISIFTEMNPCTSCANILETQARALFGTQVQINITYGVQFP